MIRLFVAALACVCGVLSGPGGLRADDEVISQTYTGAISVLASEVVTAVGGATSRALDRVEKQVLAAAVLEDAAYYLQSGELGGILPTALARLRELDPALVDANDADLVDAVVAAAVGLSE